MTDGPDAVNRPDPAAVPAPPGGASSRPAQSRRVWPAVVGDVLCVVVFTVVGTLNHATAGDLGHVALVGLPFVVALTAGWLASRAWRSPARPWPTGVGVWGVTVVLGLALRPLFGGGFAISFAVVTAAFLALTMLGWRALTALLTRRSRRP